MSCAEQRKIKTMWQPNCDFEDEMMEIQPDHDLIFADYSRNPPSLVDPCMKSGSIPQIFREETPQKLSDTKNSLIHIVSKIRQPIGRRLEEADLKDCSEREAETLAMIRNSGLAQSFDVPLSSKNTLPTITPSERYKISHRRLPLLFDSEYFKLKPRNPDSDTSGDSTFDGSGDNACDVSSSFSDSTNFLKQFKNLNVSREEEDSSKPDNDKTQDNTVKPKTPVDIIAKMKQRRLKTRMGRPVVCDEDLDENTKSQEEPPPSEQKPHTSSKIVCTKKFFTPKELYMQKRALNPSSS